MLVYNREGFPENVYIRIVRSMRSRNLTGAPEAMWRFRGS